MADQRHEREPNARRLTGTTAKVAAPLAVLATMASVSIGVLAGEPQVDATVSTSSASLATGQDRARPLTVSREAPRFSRQPTAAEKKAAADKAARDKALAAERAGAAAAVKAAKTRLWSTEELNLWDSSFPFAVKVGSVKEATQVLVTGRRANSRAEVVVEGQARWVNAAYLDAEKPAPEPSIGNASCTNGTSVPSGVSPNVRKVHQAVCANFPEIGSYGTFRGDGEHSQGLAIDIMVSGARGWEVAEFVRANRGALGVEYIIYSQKIWSVDRGGEGWRFMEDRGGATANHYDHVHVTTY